MGVHFCIVGWYGIKVIFSRRLYRGHLEGFIDDKDPQRPRDDGLACVPAVILCFQLFSLTGMGCFPVKNTKLLGRPLSGLLWGVFGVDVEQRREVGRTETVIEYSIECLHN